MSFRRLRSSWDDFLDQHSDEIQACGVPDEVMRDKTRFFVFLDHGFDQWGWARNPHSCFDARVLTDEQIGRMADFAARHFGEEYRVRVGTRWQRAW